MNAIHIEIRKERLKELQTVIFSLADRLSIGDAYKIAETIQKRKYGSRLYRTYGSFRAYTCYHRKRKKTIASDRSR